MCFEFVMTARAFYRMLAFLNRQAKLLMTFRTSAVTVFLYVYNSSELIFQLFLHWTKQFQKQCVFLLPGSEISGKISVNSKGKDQQSYNKQHLAENSEWEKAGDDQESHEEIEQIIYTISSNHKLRVFS